MHRIDHPTGNSDLLIHPIRQHIEFHDCYPGGYWDDIKRKEVKSTGSAVDTWKLWLPLSVSAASLK